MSQPIRMVCLYRVKRGKEEEFKHLLERHWPTLNRAALVTPEPAQVLYGESKDGKTTAFIELFQWKDHEAPDIAHRSPEVRAIWDPMMPLLADMEFLEVRPVEFESSAARRPN